MVRTASNRETQATNQHTQTRSGQANFQQQSRSEIPERRQRRCQCKEQLSRYNKLNTTLIFGVFIISFAIFSLLVPLLAIFFELQEIKALLV